MVDGQGAQVGQVHFAADVYMGAHIISQPESEPHLQHTVGIQDQIRGRAKVS